MFWSRGTLSNERLCDRAEFSLYVETLRSFDIQVVELKVRQPTQHP